jgi:hypothetical protein
MKRFVPLSLQANRVREGDYASDESYGLAGMFKLIGPGGTLLLVVSSGADPRTNDGWEHVSVSAEKRCPSWEEMCFVKDLFWDEHEMAVQYHPPKSEYVNFHPRTLHMWRDNGGTLMMPPTYMVGPKQRR